MPSITRRRRGPRPRLRPTLPTDRDNVDRYFVEWCNAFFSDKGFSFRSLSHGSSPGIKNTVGAKLSSVERRGFQAKSSASAAATGAVITSLKAAGVYDDAKEFIITLIMKVPGAEEGLALVLEYTPEVIKEALQAILPWWGTATSAAKGVWAGWQTARDIWDRHTLSVHSGMIRTTSYDVCLSSIRQVVTNQLGFHSRNFAIHGTAAVVKGVGTAFDPTTITQSATGTVEAIAKLMNLAKLFVDSNRMVKAGSRSCRSLHNLSSINELVHNCPIAGCYIAFYLDTSAMMGFSIEEMMSMHEQSRDAARRNGSRGQTPSSDFRKRLDQVEAAKRKHLDPCLSIASRCIDSSMVLLTSSTLAETEAAEHRRRKREFKRTFLGDGAWSDPDGLGLDGLFGGN